MDRRTQAIVAGCAAVALGLLAAFYAGRKSSEVAAQEDALVMFRTLESQLEELQRHQLGRMSKIEARIDSLETDPNSPVRTHFDELHAKRIILEWPAGEPGPSDPEKDVSRFVIIDGLGLECYATQKGSVSNLRYAVVRPAEIELNADEMRSRIIIDAGSKGEASARFMRGGDVAAEIGVTKSGMGFVDNHEQ